MNCLRAGTFIIILRAGSLCFNMHGKFSENYKQVIALSPRRIKDKFHLYFQSFHKLPSSLRDSGNFVKNLKIRVEIYP